MDPTTLAALILVGGIVIGIVLSVPIAVVIGVSSFLATIPILGSEQAVLISAQRMFTGINSFPLLAIPMFVLAGVIMNSGCIAGRLVDAAKVLIGRMPASLAQTNVAANAMFGAVSGAAVAAAAAVGNVMNNRMVAEKYDRGFAAAVNVASAPSGMLIPPSNTFIVYSLVSGTSIAALFMSGLIPGLLWAAACMIVVAIYAVRQPGRLKTADRVTFRQAMLVLWRAFPSLLMMVVLLIVGTFMDPTPAILIFVPVFLPIVQEFGIDPIHFGAMVVMNLSIGTITPPVGNVLFVGARVARLRIEPVIAKLWPFLFAIIAMLFLVVFVPQLSMWLPQLMGLV
ncbi:TRAP transporter large permease [Georgenia sp. Z1344]|uniref:TRAP transporter large permease n=1 Tax=Georgenia sp. Z1344 TaxID=3416706 RepID=UPI003CEC8B02